MLYEVITPPPSSPRPTPVPAPDVLQVTVITSYSIHYTKLYDGDLYAKLNRTREASQEYAKVADFYARDGFLLKAIAIWKKITPTLLDRVQDRHGRTLFRHDERACEGCQADDWTGQEPPQLTEVGEQVLDPIIAYQITRNNFV